MAIVCQCDRCKANISGKDAEGVGRIQINTLSILINRAACISMDKFKVWLNAPLHN